MSERIFERYRKKLCGPAGWICTFTTVNFLWLLFRSDTILQWWDIVKKIICLQDLNISDGLFGVFNLPERVFLSDTLYLQWFVENVRGFWMTVYITVSFGICLLFENNYRKLHERSWIMMAVSAAAFVWGLISLSGESVFIYLGF